MDLKNLDVAEWVKTDLVQAIMPALKSGWYIDAETHKICVEHDTLKLVTPWVNIATDTTRRCHIDQVIVEFLGFIPSRCLNCWKVCARPQNFHEAYQMIEVMQELGHPSKIGYESRDWVKDPWGAYFYCNSEAEGLDRVDEVRKAVEYINPEMRVYLKRGCTEHEVKFGPSDKYEQPPEAEAWEKLVNEHFDDSSAWFHQPVYLQRHIIVGGWVNFAWTMNDMSVLKYSKGQPIYSSLVEYKREESNA